MAILEVVGEFPNKDDPAVSSKVSNANGSFRKGGEHSRNTHGSRLTSLLTSKSDSTCPCWTIDPMSSHRVCVSKHGMLRNVSGGCGKGKCVLIALVLSIGFRKVEQNHVVRIVRGDTICYCMCLLESAVVATATMRNPSKLCARLPTPNHLPTGHRLSC